MWPVVVIFAGGFLSGLLALVALQALGVYVLIKRLNRKTQQQQASHSSSSPPPHQDLDPQQSLDYAHNKKGYVWVLDSDQVLKNWPVEKVQKDQKKKKELLEVTPIRKQAKIKDRSLILTDSGGSHRVIPLKGCSIEAVSATSLSSRKWAKRFPIKVESKTSPIYNASKTVFIFLETSWEKESWCKALRLASSDDQEKLNWFIKLNEEFLRYLTSLNTEYPSFMKPSVGFYVEPIDRASRFDGSESKVRLFWKKLAKKASKSGVENKVSSLLGREERKINDKYHPSHDPAFSGSVGKNDPTLKAPITSEEENILLPSSSTSSRASSLSQLQVISDADADEKLNVDEGTLCWNLIISRLFFDAKSNDRMKSLMQARIQRTLSNMRTPSYIGEIICTDLNLGNLPPYIHGIRVLPTHMNEVWAWEVDIEYCGGLVLDIETRLEVRDLDLQKGVVDTDVGSSSVRDASSDLLEGFEHLGKQLNFSEGTVDSQEWKDEGNPKSDKLKDSKSGISTSTNVSRWKSLLNSVAKQVSQVPLSLSIRLGSLRGTVRLHIKPPPSDQLWFGFTSTPDVEFDLESSVGERKITSGQVALYLINKFKAAIRETMVLPNCESVCIPWMLAEKNDWVPRNAAPFIWINQEAASDNAAALELLNSQLDAKTKIEAGRETSYNHPESKHQKTRNAENVQPPYSDSSDDLSSNKPSMKNDKSSQDLTSPLLANSEAQETGQNSSGYASESQSPSRSLISLEKQTRSVEEEDDSRPKKMGRRAKMLDLGKKMGEKLEEKRRNIEEKGRNIVDKMRGP
uniref:SMP-LTD domain-containing protein n=1 Tax=Populus davidiana TaxID=266767 RepID=A0A6M2F283_9ROSI